MTKEQLKSARELSTNFMKAFGMGEQEINQILSEVEQEYEVGLQDYEVESPEIGNPITVTITNGSSMVSMIIDVKDVDGETFDLHVKGNGKLQEETKPTVSDRIIDLLSDTIYATLGNFENED